MEKNIYNVRTLIMTNKIRTVKRPNSGHSWSLKFHTLFEGLCYSERINLEFIKDKCTIEKICIRKEHVKFSCVINVYILCFNNIIYYPSDVACVNIEQIK